MSKVILIMDMPKSCERCNLCVLNNDYVSLEYECRGTKIYNGYVKVHPKIDRKLLNKVQDWCPLREVPEKYETVSMDFKRGYNTCIDEILNEN